MDPLIEEYLGTLRNGGTAQIYRHALTEFCAWYAETRGSEVDWDAVFPEIIEEYADYLRSARSLSASTAGGHSTAITGFRRFRDDRASRDSAPGLRFSLWLERQVLRRDDVGKVARQHVWSGHWAEISADTRDGWVDWVGPAPEEWVNDPAGLDLWTAWCEYKSVGKIGGRLECHGLTLRVDAAAVVAAGRNGPEVYLMAVCPFCGELHGYGLGTPKVPRVGAVAEFTEGEAAKLGMTLELRVRTVEQGTAESGSERWKIEEADDEDQL